MVFRIVCTGGRDYNDDATVDMVLGCLEPDVVVAGDASGLDELVHEWCEEHGVAHNEYLANWDKHGRAAGPIRNKEMLVKGCPDLVIAFPGGRGTENCVEQAKDMGHVVLRVE